MILKADLHLHSCLSPCGDLSMSPRAIASLLEERGVTLAALTDHNSALNCPAFATACARHGIAPLFGIEAQTSEECHILCLFPRVEMALELGKELYERMPSIMNIPEKTGDQVYVDDDENILGEVDKFLVTSADFTVDGLAARVLGLGGLVIPAHVDRPSFSLTSQLGFIPDGPWDALETVRLDGKNGRAPATDMSGNPLDTKGYPLTTSSDAHHPEHVARRAFDLDIGNDPLLDAEGHVRVDTIRAALTRRTPS